MANGQRKKTDMFQALRKRKEPKLVDAFGRPSQGFAGRPVKQDKKISAQRQQQLNEIARKEREQIRRRATAAQALRRKTKPRQEIEGLAARGIKTQPPQGL